MNIHTQVVGTEHWTTKGDDVKLFLWNKCAVDSAKTVGTILFVHGSSMASQPTFDLHVPGRANSSVMEWFAERGYDTWTMDNEVYGSSSGALKAALFTERHPERVARLALDAFVWTGKGSPTLEQRRKRLPEFAAKNRRPIDRAFVHSIFERDHPGTADKATIEAFADEILKLDNSVPTGTYVDMCSKLPLVDPQKITVPSNSPRMTIVGTVIFMR